MGLRDTNINGAGRLAQLIGALSCTPKGSAVGLTQLRHIPGLRVPSPVKAHNGVGEVSMFLSHIDVTHSLSRISDHILR